MTPAPASPDGPPDEARTPAAQAGGGRRESFVARLAHELRNPLAPIRSGVALLQSDRLDAATRQATLAMMERQLAHLVRLIDDLLASVSKRPGDLPATAERAALAEGPGSALERVAPAGLGAAPGPAWRSRRILVVDDNHDAAHTLGALFELDGHTIRLAHDGPAAVAGAREFGPEIVMMDIGLPGFSGLVATREIRKLALESRPMIVALTGWGSSADREATRLAGCDLHLVKPIEYREIVRALAASVHQEAG